MKLNPNQQLAVDTIEGPVAVYAGPGSGKTRTLVERIKNMVLVKKINPVNILAITFTVKAAEEMKERLSESVDVEQMTVGTFHSFAINELLAHIGRFNMLDEKQSIALAMKIASDKKLKLSSTKYYEFMKRKDTPNFSEQFEWWKKNIKSKKDQEQFEILNAYQEYVTENNYLDFPDMLRVLLENLENNKYFFDTITDKYLYIMVDEYQDTNPLQYMIVKKISEKNKNIFVVGDDDQSIYGFRGADFTNIMNFGLDFPDAKLIFLEQNYRTNNNIVQMNIGMVSNNKNRTSKKCFSENESMDFKAKKIVGKNRYDLVSKLAEEINNLQKKDIAILCRTNFDVKFVENRLLNENISVDHKQTIDLSDMKRILQTSSSMTNIALKNYFKDFSKLDNRSLDRIWEAEGDFLTSYKNIILPAKAKMIIKREIEFLEKIRSWEAKFALNFILKNFMTRKVTEDQFNFLEKAITELVETNKLTAIEELEMKYENHIPKTGIKVMTAHGSKGLEFDTVFVFNASEEVFPFKFSMNNEESIEEERRVFYVATTRAKNNLFICCDNTKKESRFVGELFNAT